MTTAMTRKLHPFYNFDKVMSYNGTYNFVVGGRGIGKTYGKKKRAIKSFIKRGEQFIYLRRYKTELVTARNTFFADIAHEFPDWDFRVQGNTAEIAPRETRDDKKRQWQTMAYFIALSTAQTQKSVAFPRVRTIIFDEFIIETGSLHYLPDESKVFNNFYSTVDRWQDKTRVWFLANSVSIMNPYFIAHEIIPDENSEFVIRKDGFIVCHFPDAENFSNSVYETRFGKFIKDTDYAEYAVGNQFSDNHDSLIGGKSSRARYIYTLETRNGKFSVWHDMYADEYTIQAKLPKQETVFTIVPEKHGEDKLFMTYTDRPLQHLRAAWRAGKVLFDKPATRNTFIEVFKR